MNQDQAPNSPTSTRGVGAVPDGCILPVFFTHDRLERRTVRTDHTRGEESEVFTPIGGDHEDWGSID
jgi:hypothetical protein